MTTNDIKTLISSHEPGNLELKKATWFAKRVMGWPQRGIDHYNLQHGLSLRSPSVFPLFGN